jgi:hypothetical protein
MLRFSAFLVTCCWFTSRPATSTAVSPLICGLRLLSAMMSAAIGGHRSATLTTGGGETLQALKLSRTEPTSSS